MVALFLTFILVFGFGITHTIHIGVTPGKFMDQIGCPMVGSVQDKYPPHSTIITLAPLGCGFIFKDQQSSPSLFFSFLKSSEHRRKHQASFQVSGYNFEYGAVLTGFNYGSEGSGMGNVGR